MAAKLALTRNGRRLYLGKLETLEHRPMKYREQEDILAAVRSHVTNKSSNPP